MHAERELVLRAVADGRRRSFSEITNGGATTTDEAQNGSGGRRRSSAGGPSLGSWAAALERCILACSPNDGADYGGAQRLRELSRAAADELEVTPLFALPFACCYGGGAAGGRAALLYMLRSLDRSSSTRAPPLLSSFTTLGRTYRASTLSQPPSSRYRPSWVAMTAMLTATTRATPTKSSRTCRTAPHGGGTRATPPRSSPPRCATSAAHVSRARRPGRADAGVCVRHARGARASPCTSASARGAAARWRPRRQRAAPHRRRGARRPVRRSSSPRHRARAAAERPPSRPPAVTSAWRSCA